LSLQIAETQGHGVEWNEQISRDRGGPSDAGSSALMMLLKKVIDTKRLGCVGVSYGGYLCFYLLVFTTTVSKHSLP
jgi:dipeptidyl aminopeptidase/acylaminoacyl peptidase